jgi:hypothetical protein
MQPHQSGYVWLPTLKVWARIPNRDARAQAQQQQLPAGHQLQRNAAAQQRQSGPDGSIIAAAMASPGRAAASAAAQGARQGQVVAGGNARGQAYTGFALAEEKEEGDAGESEPEEAFMEPLPSCPICEQLGGRAAHARVCRVCI